ncbi:hypothetical protein HGH93_24825 [Chitinophaga polysaccharea]|nr:hypothetical protein [Chitinophaga polysaccharea]
MEVFTPTLFTNNFHGEEIMGGNFRGASIHYVFFQLIISNLKEMCDAYKARQNPTRPATNRYFMAFLSLNLFLSL